MVGAPVGGHDGAVLVDDTGTVFTSDPGRVRRVVSLVPSLTESVAASAPGLLVGATDWCSHPADLEVVRVGGTKNPVLCRRRRPGTGPRARQRGGEPRRGRRSAEGRGLAVWVTAPHTLGQAFGSLRRMLAACGLPEQEWLDVARRAWSNTYDDGPLWAAAVVPVWRRPWQVAADATPSPATCCATSGWATCSAAAGSVPQARARGDRRQRGRPGGAAGRALPLPARRRAGGLPRDPGRPRLGTPSHLVRAVLGGGSGRPRRSSPIGASRRRSSERRSAVGVALVRVGCRRRRRRPRRGPLRSSPSAGPRTA